MTLYAIWYDTLLDGVTSSHVAAEAARDNGATVIPFEAPKGRDLTSADIPVPEEPRLPLGWSESEVVQ
jgi:hypothetical protein